ncbi:unnamed protein product [Porites lobata]|uniref:Uncharacterized protein n=1 Tax=Porites lobata TaxID=104759 RepID=A0ABN8N7V6_9CNID|nr:unnamed protein product [Porites lobata]
MIIINAFHGLRRRRLIAIQLHRRILRRRRRRHRPRFWRLPRPMNSWFEIHYNDPLIPDDYFKEQLRVTVRNGKVPSKTEKPKAFGLSYLAIVNEHLPWYLCIWLAI